MYARGMSTRDIQAQLEELYQVEVSPSLIGEVTDGVMDDARASFRGSTFLVRRESPHTSILRIGVALNE